MNSVTIDFEHLFRYWHFAQALFRRAGFTKGYRAGPKLWQPDLVQRSAGCGASQRLVPQVRADGNLPPGIEEGVASFRR